MQPQRRSFFGYLLSAFTGGFASAWWSDRKAAAADAVKGEHGDPEQLQVQLAGCLTAAEGGTSEPVVATRGMYGWSPAYQAVLDLRRKYDELVKKTTTRLEATEHFDPATDKIMIAYAGCIPSPPQLHSSCLVFREKPFGMPAPTVGHVCATSWIEEIPDVSQIPDDCYPRARMFPNKTVMLIGTIDELVVYYRECLEAAARSMFSTDYAHITGSGARNKAMQPVYQQHCQTSPVGLIGIHAGHRTGHPIVDAYVARTKRS